MTVKNTPEERQLITLIGKLPLDEAEKAAWIEQIHVNGMSDELAAQIHHKLSTPPEHDPHAANRARLLLDLNRLINRWRLVNQKKNFKR